MWCVLTVHRDDDVLVNVDDDTSTSPRSLRLNAAAATAAVDTDYRSCHRRRPLCIRLLLSTARFQALYAADEHLPR